MGKKPDIVNIEKLDWIKVSASEMKVEGGRLFVTSDSSEAGYQVMSRQIHISEIESEANITKTNSAENDSLDSEALKNDSHSVIVSLKGTVKGGNYTLGMLTGDQSSWIAQVSLEAGKVDEILQFDAVGQQSFYLILANGGSGGGIAEFEEFKVMLREPDGSGLPASEMNQTGWGVGYSAAGEVIAVGAGVKGLKVGDYVACGGAGQANHADFVSVKRNLVVSVPKGVAPHLAATTTVGSIAMQGVRRADMRLGETVCVIGLGLIGLMTVQMLKAAGCHVLGLDLDENRVELAKKLGADIATVNSAEFERLSLHMTGGHGADATIITAAGKTDAIINGAMKTTRRRGKVVIVGDIGMNIERPVFYKKEIDLLMSTSYGPGRYDRTYEVDGRDYPYAFVRWTQNRNMQAYLDLVSRDQIDIDALITKIVPIEVAPTAYEALAKAKEQPIGVILAYQPEEKVNIETTSIDRRESARIAVRGARKQRGEALGYCLVGAGGFGTSMLVPQMDKRKDAYSLKGVVSRDPVRAGNFSRMRQLELMATDIETVLQDPSVDLLVVATRHDDHANKVIKCLEAGKHVFVEKPLVLTWEELSRVQMAYNEREKNTVLMVGFNRRFAPATLVVKEKLADRTSPLVINYRLNGGYIPAESWIQDESGGGRNLGEACHMYDFFRSLTGAKPVSITATPIAPGKSAYFPTDNFSATIAYEDGSIGNLVYTANGTKQGLPKERVEIHCEGKSYLIDDYLDCVEYPSGDSLWSSKTHDKGHFKELSMLADELLAGSDQGPIPAEEIFETSAVALHIEDLLQGRV